MNTKNLLEFSEKYLEKKSMDQCVKRTKLTRKTLQEAIEKFSDKIRDIKGDLGDKYIPTDIEDEGGFQHLDKGVGLGYIQIDQSENLADDKNLQK